MSAKYGSHPFPPRNMWFPKTASRDKSTLDQLFDQGNISFLSLPFPPSYPPSILLSSPIYPDYICPTILSMREHLFVPCTLLPILLVYLLPCLLFFLPVTSFPLFFSINHHHTSFWPSYSSSFSSLCTCIYLPLPPPFSQNLLFSVPALLSFLLPIHLFWTMELQMGLKLLK